MKVSSKHREVGKARGRHACQASLKIFGSFMEVYGLIHQHLPIASNVFYDKPVIPSTAYIAGPIKVALERLISWMF